MYFLLTVFATTEIIFGINLIGLFPIPSSDMTQASDYNKNPYCSYNINPNLLVWLNRIAFQSFNAMIISLNFLTIYLVDKYQIQYDKRIEGQERNNSQDSEAEESLLPR